MNLFAQTPLGSDAVDIPKEQHADHQFRVNRRPACGTAERRQMRADRREIHEPVNGPKQMIRRNMVVETELIKQSALRRLP